MKSAMAPCIMGILNVTPDSFSDGGEHDDIEGAVAHANRMADEGAAIIDIGGESTRPGSERVDVATQIARTADVVAAVRERLPGDVRISIDTTQVAVAEAALDAGADIINDVAGGTESDTIALAAERDVTIVLMHKQGDPATMQDNPTYQDVVAEVETFLLQQAEAASGRGLDADKVWIDPGIGFGKTATHNLKLLRGLECLAGNGLPILLGTSRKRFMKDICGAPTPKGLLGATCATTAWGLQAGVSVFRVHEVRENRQVLDVYAALTTDT